MNTTWNFSMSMSKVKFQKEQRKIILFKMDSDLWIWNQKRYDSHEMALMLIDILHQRKMINDATYHNILNASRMRLRRTA